MRLVQQKAACDSALIALALSLCIFSFIWFIGSFVFWRAELDTGGWSYFESLYFTYVSFLTVGYGDFEVRQTGVDLLTSTDSSGRSLAMQERRLSSYGPTGRADPDSTHWRYWQHHIRNSGFDHIMGSRSSIGIDTWLEESEAVCAES